MKLLWSARIQKVGCNALFEFNRTIDRALSVVPIVEQIVVRIHENNVNPTLNQSLLSYRQWRETNSADPILSFINPSASCRI